MNDIAESPGGVQSKSVILLDFLIGGLKLLLILAPAWIPALLVFSGGSNCRGDCAAGMVMLVLMLIVYAGPVILLVGVPIVLGLLIWWTKGRPAQLLGGIALIPLLLMAWWGFTYIRDTVVSSRIEAGIRPEYLSRTIANPVGRLEMLALVDDGGDCHDKCYEILVDGISSKYSTGYIGNNGGAQKLFEKAFILSTGEECLSQAYSTERSIDDLQSRGIFGTCILDARADPPITAIVLRGANYDRYTLVRPYGLQTVQVLQAITDGELRQELVRWEYGTLPGSQKRIGTPFQWDDLIRAYTGISTDRFADAQKLDHSQRIDAILKSGKAPPLQLYSVFSYLRAAPDAFRYSGREQKLPDEDIPRLKAIGKRICAATPMVKGFNSELVDCLKSYNDLVRNAYPADAQTLMLD